MKEKIKDFYSIQEFADLLSVHHNTIRRAIKSGHINAFRINGNPQSNFRIPHTEIQKLAIMQYEGIVSKIAKAQTQGK